MYSNPPYTDAELEYFEDAWGSSVCGATIDKLVEYTFGYGIKPTFELIDDNGLDDDQKKKELKKYEDELNELVHYDKKINFEIGPRRDGDVEEIYSDNTKVEKLLNWKAKISVEKAMKDAWHWEQKKEK